MSLVKENATNAQYGVDNSNCVAYNGNRNTKMEGGETMNESKIETRKVQIESALAGITKLRETATDEQKIAYGFLLGLGAQIPVQQKAAGQ